MVDNQSAVEYAPQKGPQELFAASPADIAIYGGSAGGGKSWALIAEAARWFDVPGYNAILFRRTAPEIRGGGGLWPESQQLYRALGGDPREQSLDWRFASGARVEMSHLQHEHDVYAHHGRQYAMIGFDELCTFEESQWWYLLSRLRSTCGVRPYMRATCNPDPDSFVKRLIAWWIGDDGMAIRERSGIIRWMVRAGDEISWFASDEEARRETGADPLSLTFVAATLADNKKGDPTYRARLEMLPRVERERLLGGNWNVRASAGDYYRRGMFQIVDAAPASVVRRVRAWDRAATKPSPTNQDPDWTIGLLASKTADGTIYVEHVERMREEPTAVDAAQRRLAEQDGRDTVVAVFQDPGAAGKAEAQHITRSLHGREVHVEIASQNKIAYARPVASQAGAGNIRLVRGAWNEPFLASLEGFPTAKHDDDVDALSLASLVLSLTRSDPYLL